MLTCGSGVEQSVSDWLRHIGVLVYSLYRIFWTMRQFFILDVVVSDVVF